MYLPVSILVILLHSRLEIPRKFLRIGLTYPWSTLKYGEVRNFPSFILDLSAYQYYINRFQREKHEKTKSEKARKYRKNSSVYKRTQILVVLGCKSRLLILTRKRLQSVDVKRNKSMWCMVLQHLHTRLFHAKSWVGGCSVTGIPHLQSKRPAHTHTFTWKGFAPKCETF